MPLYMMQFTYTQKAWTALAQNPEDRSVVVRGLLKDMGCQFKCLYYTFGEYDGFLLYEAPDETTAAAFVLEATSPGHIKANKTTTAFTPENLVEALRKTRQATYRGPGE